MITYCPHCKESLKQSGGIKHCSNCNGKFYILEYENWLEARLCPPQ